jgi:hypothetical protein
MPSVNALGGVLHGTGGGGAYYQDPLMQSERDVQFDTGGGPSWYDQVTAAYQHEGPDGIYLAFYDVITKQIRRAVTSNASRFYDKGASAIYAKDGVWAAWLDPNRYSGIGLYASTGFHKPAAGLIGLGAGGAIAYRPDREALPVRVREQDGTDWLLSNGDVYDLCIPGRGKAIWTAGQVAHVHNLPPISTLPVPVYGTKAILVDGRWWAMYWTEKYGLVLHPFDELAGYQLVGPGLPAFDPDIVVHANNHRAVRAVWSIGAGGLLGEVRHRDIDVVSTPTIDFEDLIQIEVPQINRALWVTWFEFKEPPMLPPGNAMLRVHELGLVRALNGTPIAQWVQGNSVDEIEQAARSSSLPAIAYWDARAWPRLPQLPNKAYLGVQAYCRREETLKAFEEQMRTELAKAPGRRLALICQCYTSNQTLTKDLGSLVPVFARLCRDVPAIEMAVIFSDFGRGTGLQDHPDVRPYWEQFAASVRSPPIVVEPPSPPTPPVPDPPPVPPTPPEVPVPQVPAPSLHDWITSEYPQVVAAFQTKHPGVVPGYEWAAFQTARRAPALPEGRWAFEDMLEHERSDRPKTSEDSGPLPADLNQWIHHELPQLVALYKQRRGMTPGHEWAAFQTARRGVIVPEGRWTLAKMIAHEKGEPEPAPVEPEPAARRTGLVSLEGRCFRDDGGRFMNLNCSAFTALYLHKFDRDRLEQNLKYLADHGFNSVRWLSNIGKAYFQDRPVDMRWPDHQQQMEQMVDLMYDKYGLRSQMVIFGGAGDEFCPTHEQERVLVDRCAAVYRGREHKFIFVEGGNESWQTGFNGVDGTNRLKDHVRRFRDLVASWGSHVPALAITSPAGPEAYGAPADQHDFGYRLTYEGSVATIGTYHLDRGFREEGWGQLHQGWDCPFPGMPTASSDNEPIGQRASVREESDPHKIVGQFVVDQIAGLTDYCWHTKCGVWFGGVFVESGQDRGAANLWEEPNADATVQGFRAAQAYLPAGIPSWQKFQPHWAGHPFKDALVRQSVYDEDANRNGTNKWPHHGAYRAYGAVGDGQAICVPIGLRGTMELRAAWPMDVKVVHILTGDVISRHSLGAGEVFTVSASDCPIPVILGTNR